MKAISVLGSAIVAFVATNTDDIFVLTFLFAQKNLKRWYVVAGQYLGLAGLIAISLFGYFARLIRLEILSVICEFFSCLRRAQCLKNV